MSIESTIPGGPNSTIPPSSGSGSGITQLTSDVTAGPGSGSQAATIASDAVTYAKMQNVSAASKLLGRGDSGSGDPQEITVGTNLTMTGTTLSATGGSGITQLTADVTAGPGSGSQAATIPNDTVTYAKMQNVSAASKLLGRGDSGSGDPQEITLDSSLTMTGTTLSATGSGGITQLTSDVTAGPGSGSQAATIASDAVTYAKMQNVSAASKLLGRGDSGSGDPQEITLGTNLTMTGTTLAATGGGAGPTIVRKTADEIVNNSTTLQADDELLVAIGSSETLVLQYHLQFSSPQSADLSYFVKAPASSTGWQGGPNRLVTTATSSGAVVADAVADVTNDASFVRQAGSTGARQILLIDAVVTSAGTSGNIQLLWAQNSAVASDTTVYTGSYVIVFPVA